VEDSDALAAVDASTCCAVLLGPWFPHLKTSVLLLVAWDMPCCALASALVMFLGVHCVSAFTCGNVLLDHYFFLLDFAFLKD